MYDFYIISGLLGIVKKQELKRQKRMKGRKGGWEGIIQLRTAYESRDWLDGIRSVVLGFVETDLNILNRTDRKVFCAQSQFFCLHQGESGRLVCLQLLFNTSL